GDTSNPVFEFRLNQTSGAFTFNLFDELLHEAPDSGSDQNTDLRSGLDGATISSINFGKIIKATDADGDSVTLDGRVGVTIRDDVPEAELVREGGSVKIDETAGQQNDDTTSGSVAALFSGVLLTGVDPDLTASPINYAISNGALEVVDDRSEEGADAPPAVRSLSLEISNAASGLSVTDGSAINLVKEGNLIVGRVAAGTFAGQAAFAIAVTQEGDIAVAQYLSLRHGNTGSDDEEVNLSGKINVKLTLTDADGDTSTDTVAIGDLVQFDDDGPSVGRNATVALEDEDVVGVAFASGGAGDDDAPLNATGTLAHDYGSDGAGSVLLRGAGLPSSSTTNNAFFQTVASNGLSMTISQVQSGVSVVVLTITLTNATSGAYSVVQNKPILHPTLNGQSGDDTENNVTFEVDYRVTDGDDDRANGTLNINIDDDMPNPLFVVPGIRLVTHDETFGVDGANDTATDLSALFSSVTNKATDPDVGEVAGGAIGYAQGTAAAVTVTPNYGADGAGSVSYAFVVPGGSEPSGLFTTSGQAIRLFELSPTLIVGRYEVSGPDPVAFAIHMNAATGIISVAQYVSLRHNDTANPDDAVSIINASVRVVATVTDRDGDSVSSQEFSIGNQIVFEDDGPSLTVDVANSAAAVAALAVNLDETIGLDRSNTPTETADGNTDDDVITPVDQYLGRVTTAVTGSGLASLFTIGGAYGSDGAGTTTGVLSFTGFPLTGGMQTNLLATDGGLVTLFQVNQSLLEGRDTNNNVVLRIEIVPVGAAQQLQTTQLEALVHADQTKFDDVVTLQLAARDGADPVLGLKYTVTRVDGDG
ncbi:MAG: DUF5801 repeats-in-toxin domain-containing protein, partial [Notoacmeibacter sp.]